MASTTTSAASKRSAIGRQRMALERMRSGRSSSLSITALSPEGKMSSSRLPLGAMSPPQEVRVLLLPRIAEYRSKGWITAQEESDYHQLLSSCRPKQIGGETRDQVALQVKKSLDLAKVKHEQASLAAAAANQQSSVATTGGSRSGNGYDATATNSRSLFRKPTGGGELTLQKKLSVRRTSRVMAAAGEASSPDKNGNTSEGGKTSDGTMEPQEISVIEAMFGKDKSKDAVTSTTPTSKRKNRLAKARSRREHTRRHSPESSIQSNALDVTEQQRDDHATGKTSIELTQRTSKHSVPASPTNVADELRENAEDGSADDTTTMRQQDQVLRTEPSVFESSSSKQDENRDEQNKNFFFDRPAATLTGVSEDGIPRSAGVTQPTKQQHGVLNEAPALSHSKLTNANNSRTPGGTPICEPWQLCQPTGGMKQQLATARDEQVKDLFVEMAFFARLGFVQPPSCLHCVYRESIDNAAPNLSCKRFVPWRKDANVPVHPHLLQDNILLVQCHVARMLVQGEQVEQYEWDKMKRQLKISPP